MGGGHFCRLPWSSGAKALVLPCLLGGTTGSRAFPVRATNAALKRRSSTFAYAALLGPLASVVLASICFSVPGFSKPTLTLICLGLASAFLGNAIFSTPLS